MNFPSGEGTGTAFHVTLLFAIDPTPTAVADNTADSIDLTGMQILLAEDNELNMEIKQFFIEQYGAPSSRYRMAKKSSSILPPPPLARSTSF